MCWKQFRLLFHLQVGMAVIATSLVAVAVGPSSVAKRRLISPFCPACSSPMRCKQAVTETLWKQSHLLGACLYVAWLHQDTKGERSNTCFSLTQLLNTSSVLQRDKPSPEERRSVLAEVLGLHS